jgi:hypothetical protein
MTPATTAYDPLDAADMLRERSYKGLSGVQARALGLRFQAKPVLA